MKKFNNVLWGMILIIIGVIIGLNSLKITNINLFFDGWWTLFIIVPCFIGLFTEKEKTGNLIGLLVGIILLLCCQNILSFNYVWKLILPIILIIIGLSFIFKETFNRELNEKIKKLNNKKDDKNEYSATFSSQKLNFDNEKFSGADLNAIFGEIKCDLRNAKIGKEVVINTLSVFGGINIYVPENTIVKIKSSSIFGGVDNKQKMEVKDDKNTITIYINAVCVFGGVEIK